MTTGNKNSDESVVKIRDLRNLPVYFIHKALIDLFSPSPKALVAYNALAYFADRAGVSIASIPNMARKFSTSEDSMRRGLQELREKKAIIARERFKSGGRRRTAKQREQLPTEYILIDLAAPEGSPI